MDLGTILNYVDNLFAFLAVLAAIVFVGRPYYESKRRVQAGAVQPAVQPPTPTASETNGSGVSANYVNRVVAENCRDCKRIDDVEKQITLMDGNLSRRLERIEGILMERKGA
ncbi:MAG: hypothetical protein V2A73_08215 [Pseudomonadota bacterium]